MTIHKSVKTQLESLSNEIDKKLAKQQKEQAFAEKANLKFEENLLAFKHYFPEIFEKYIDYIPNEKFQLIVNEDGTANIVDYDTNVPMYSENPIQQVEEQVRKNIESPILGKTDHSRISSLENELDFVHVELMKSLGVVFNKAKVELQDNSTLDKELPSLMLFGIGLGYHLNMILQDIKIDFINILEPNEDYFFASLFVADWKCILETIDKSGSFLYLGIGKTESEVFKELYERTRNVGVASVSYTWFYQHYPSSFMNKWIEEFKVNYHQFFTGFGFFDDALMGIAHTLGNLDNGLNLINSEHKLSRDIESFPIFIVANGPSLDQEIDFLKKMQSKVVVVACNSASTALVREGIIPDFHVALERTELTYDFLRDFLPESARKQINLLVTNVMHPTVSGLFPWVGYGLKGNESSTQLIHLSEYFQRNRITQILSFCNPLVGNTALSYVCHLGLKNVYLFGVDNGYIDESYHHSKSSFYYENSEGVEHKPLKIGQQISVPGNFVPAVLTDEFMSVGIKQMEKLIHSFQSKGINFYNCSNGAKINGALPLRSDNILLEQSSVDKNYVIDYIKSNCFSVRNSTADVEALLNFDEFEACCNTMIEFLKEDVKVRGEALSALLSSIRYLYSFKSSTNYLNLFLLLEGEALYTTSVLVSLLYNYGDEESIMPYYRKALNLWIEFLEQAPDYYRNNFRVCK